MYNGIMEEEFEDTKWGNQNPYIEEEQTTQRSTKHTHKTNDQVTRTMQNTGCKLRCSGRVGSLLLH